MIETIQKYLPCGFVGTLLEVGAGFPELGSPVFPFRRLGWKIISVEPNPVFCNEFRLLGLPILEFAAYSSDIGETEFNVYPNGLSFSSLKIARSHPVVVEETNGEYNENTARGNNLSKSFDWNWFPRNGERKIIKVQALTLNTILKNHHPELTKIDVMVVDVEGCEFDVMNGIDLEKYKPDVIVLENLSNDTRCEPYMNENGYLLSDIVYFDSFYTRQ